MPDLVRPEFMWITLADIPQDIQDEFRMQTYAVNGRVLMKLTKGIYGLPQAGFLAQQALVTHLEAQRISRNRTHAVFIHTLQEWDKVYTGSRRLYHQIYE